MDDLQSRMGARGLGWSDRIPTRLRMGEASARGGGRRRRKLSRAKRVRALGSQVDRQKRSMLGNVILKDTKENVNEGNEGLTMADLTGAVTDTLASSLVRTCGQVEAHAAADCCLCCNTRNTLLLPHSAVLNASQLQAPLCPALFFSSLLILGVADGCLLRHHSYTNSQSRCYEITVQRQQRPFFLFRSRRPTAFPLDPTLPSI